jgi:hypothetical protein
MNTPFTGAGIYVVAEIVAGMSDNEHLERHAKTAFSPVHETR